MFGFNITSIEHSRGTATSVHEEVIFSYLPRPDVDHHVVLVSHADDVFAVGGERHAGDAVFVRLELGHLSSFRHVPQPHRREVTALVEGTKSSWLLKKGLSLMFKCQIATSVDPLEQYSGPVYPVLSEIILSAHRVQLTCPWTGITPCQGSKGQRAICAVSYSNHAERPFKGQS